jgi:hypothetical protein
VARQLSFFFTRVQWLQWSRHIYIALDTTKAVFTLSISTFNFHPSLK